MKGNSWLTIWSWTAALLCGSFLLPKAFFNAAIGLWVISGILYAIKEGQFQTRLFLKNPGIALVLLFGVLSLALLWSPNIRTGWSLLERSLLFLICPLLMGFLKNREHSKHYTNFALKGFVIGTSAILLKGIAIATFLAITTKPKLGVPWSSNYLIVNTHSHFTYWGFSENVGMHAGYLAAYLVAAFFMGISILPTLKNALIKHALQIVLGLLFLFVFLMKSSSISILFMLLLSMLLAQPKYLKKRARAGIVLGAAYFMGMIVIFDKANFPLSWTIALGLLTVGLAMGFLIPLFLSKLRRLRPSPIAFTGLLVGILIACLAIPSLPSVQKWTQAHPSNSAIRMYTWKAASHSIAKNFFAGQGNGGAYESIEAYYKANDLEQFSTLEYNEHNQYMRYWLEGGIVALLCFLAFLFMGYKSSIKAAHFPLLTLVLIVAVFCITESALVRRSLISLSSFFIVLFSYSIQHRFNNQPAKNALK